MKYIALAFLWCTSVFADQVLDFGYFYSDHKEEGYKYNVGGLELSYKLGNLEELHAHGLVWCSTANALTLLKTRDMIKYGIKLDPIKVTPIVGMQHFNHNVIRGEKYKTHVIKTHLLFGGMLSSKLFDTTFSMEFMHGYNTLNCVMFKEETMFLGQKCDKHHIYILGFEVLQHMADGVSLNLKGELEKCYNYRDSTLTFEAGLNFTF